jgi:hypothetical protein
MVGPPSSKARTKGSQATSGEGPTMPCYRFTGFIVGREKNLDHFDFGLKIS